MHKASVVIPTLNCSHILKQTLIGLSNQLCSKDSFEVIISDDGSSDNISNIIHEFRNKISVIFLSRDKKNHKIRMSTCRNKGIIAANYETIIVLDADCIPNPHFIQSHLELHQHTVNSTVVIGLRKFIEVKKEFLDNNNFEDLFTLPDIISISNSGRLKDRRLPEFNKYENHPMPFNCFHTCNASFSKEQAIQVGLFDTDFDGYWGYEDIEFAYRLWKNGSKFVYAPDICVIHQENELWNIEDRVIGKKINFDLACIKIPRFKEFRETLGR